MNRPWLFLAFLAFAGCSSNETNSVLTQAPYKPLTDSIREFPSNADIYYRRGVMLFGANEFAYASADFRRAFDLQPTEDYALSAITALKRINVDSAKVFTAKALKKIPNSIALNIGLARALESEGKYDQAVAVCDKVLQEIPDQPNALRLKASLLKTQNKLPEYFATMESARSAAPDDADLAYTLAFDYAEAKNSKVLKLADSLIAISGNSPEPYFFKGVYFANISNYPAAIQQFDQAIVQDKNFLDAYLNKAIAYYDQKQYPNALKTLNLSISIKSDFAGAYYWTGKTLEATGNLKEAKLKYEQAYGFDKSMTEAKEAAEKLK